MKNMFFAATLIFGLWAFGADVKQSQENPGPADSQDQNTSVREDVSINQTKKMTAEQSAQASDSALKVMKKIAQARGDIHKKKWASAKKDLREATSLVEDVRADEPTYRVRDRLWIAQKHLEYEDTDQVVEDLVPIYNDLSFAEGFVSTQEARTHLAKARDSLKNGDKTAAHNELKLAGDSLTYTEVDLPLGKTEESIMDARLLLGKNKGAEADRVLKDAEDSIIVTMDALVATPEQPSKQVQEQQAKRDKIRKK